MKPLTASCGLLLACLIDGPGQNAAFAAPPRPSFSIDNAAASSALREICFPVRKHGQLNNLPSTVTFYTVAGTAKDVTDFAPQRVMMTFQPTELKKLGCVPINTSSPSTGAKTLTGKLLAGTNARLYDATAVGTINFPLAPPPPAPQPTRVFNCPDVSVPEDAGTVRITCPITGNNGRPSYVSFGTGGGMPTAVAGVDYIATSAGGRFVPYDATAFAFDVQIKGNDKPSGEHTFGTWLTVDQNGSAEHMSQVTMIDNEAALPPDPGPAPDPMPTPVPTPTSGELAAIPSNFDINQEIIDLGAGGIPGSAAPDTLGAFRFICTPGPVLKIDPIVYPGQPDKSHWHQFYGNLDVDSYSTYESLRGHGLSSCMSPVNRSAYWMPALLNGLGFAVRPDYVAIYYKRFPKTSLACTTAADACVPLPRGLRFVFGADPGNSAAVVEERARASFLCDASAVNSALSVASTHDMNKALATCPVGGKFIVTLEAPGCWDGYRLDSSNHRDHVRYGTSTGCPAGNRYQIPDFLMAAAFTIAAGDDTTKWSFSSDMTDLTKPRGWSFHGDWFGAWDPIVQAMWTDNCLDKLLNCSSGILGNGKIIKNNVMSALPRLVPAPGM